MNESEFFDHEKVIISVENVLFPLISVLGFLTNAFVILIIVVSEKSRSNRTVANTFVLNLAIADILFLLALPFYTPSLHINGFPFGGGMCKVLETMKHISYHASILFLTGMSFDRYIAIVHSLRSLEYRTQRNARIVCAVLWLISIVVTIPIMAYSNLLVWVTNGTATISQCRQTFPGYEELFVQTNLTDLYEGFENYSIYDEHNSYEYDGSGPEYNYALDYSSDGFACSNDGHQNSQVYVVWQWITFSVFFVLPVLVILFCYFKIWRATVIRKVRSQRAEGNQEQQNLQTESPPKQSWKQIQSKVTVMVAILVSGFIVCWMPFQIWLIMNLPPGHKVKHAHTCGIINAVVSLLAWSNSVLNPILYSLTSENFRKRAMTTIFYMRYGYRRTLQASRTQTTTLTVLRNLECNQNNENVNDKNKPNRPGKNRKDRSADGCEWFLPTI